jgi:hypothetical protein
MQPIAVITTRFRTGTSSKITTKESEARALQLWMMFDSGYNTGLLEATRDRIGIPLIHKQNALASRAFCLLISLPGKAKTGNTA